MVLFHHDSPEAKAHQEYQSQGHQSKISHELMSGAAAFAAAHEYEKYVAAHGKPENHARAKELIAGFTGAFIDKEFESRGLDAIDKERAKHSAKTKAEKALETSGQF